MTGNDLLAVAPWVVFAAGVAAVGLRLRASRRIARRARRARHASSRPGQRPPPGTMDERPGGR